MVSPWPDSLQLRQVAGEQRIERHTGSGAVVEVGIGVGQVANYAILAPFGYSSPPK